MRFARSRPTVVTCMADGSSLWRHTTTTTLGTRCRSAGAVHPINYNFSLREHQSHSLVRFLTQVALEQELTVVRTDAPGNPAHAEVQGKKTQGKANALRDASE